MSYRRPKRDSQRIGRFYTYYGNPTTHEEIENNKKMDKLIALLNKMEENEGSPKNKLVSQVFTVESLRVLGL